jgi:hypothetical protein
VREDSWRPIDGPEVAGRVWMHGFMHDGVDVIERLVEDELDREGRPSSRFNEGDGLVKRTTLLCCVDELEEADKGLKVWSFGKSCSPSRDCVRCGSLMSEDKFIGLIVCSLFKVHQSR